MNLIKMLTERGGVECKILRAGGCMLVDMFCLGSIYTVTRRQVDLSPDLRTISLSDGNIATLSFCLSAASQTSINLFLNFGQLQV